METPEKTALLDSIGTPISSRDLKSRVSDKFVLYFSYGSNLYPYRLKLYLEGGVAPGGAHTYLAHANQILTYRISCQIPHRMGFAEVSKIWNNGGKGFIDPAVEPNPSKHTLGAMYLMHVDQFTHVVGQENWQDPYWREQVDASRDGIDIELAPRSLPLKELIAKKEPGIPAMCDSGYVSSYNQLMLLGFASLPGHEDNPRAELYPVMTFTREKSLVGAPDLNEPSPEYLQFIAAGLKTSFPAMTTRDIAEYLSGTSGIGDWTPDSIETSVTDLVARAEQESLRLPDAMLSEEIGHHDRRLLLTAKDMFPMLVGYDSDRPFGISHGRWSQGHRLPLELGL